MPIIIGLESFKLRKEIEKNGFGKIQGPLNYSFKFPFHEGELLKSQCLYYTSRTDRKRLVTKLSADPVLLKKIKSAQSSQLVNGRQACKNPLSCQRIEYLPCSALNSAFKIK